MLRKIGKMFLWIVGSGLGLFLVIALFLYFNQGNLIFVPSKNISVTPDQVGLAFEDVTIEVEPGTKIHGWYFGVDAAKATVLFCHGNAGNISGRLSTAAMLTSLGVNVFMFDYRGYGRSEGQPTEANVYSDARVAYDWLLSEKNIAPQGLYLFGRSLGGAVAIYLARTVNPAGLIVESSFTSITDMGKHVYPLFPIEWMVRYNFDSKSKISEVGCPVLVMHSPDDRLIPSEMGSELFKLSKEPKSWFELHGDHNELSFISDQSYLDHLTYFMGLKER